ncbi:MAG: hypothetical protein NZM11_05890 [Anaerolineales bacterium]|nr:hypothetical protein [Anaerolineales bacterium]
MSKHALFEGLVVDENGNPVTTAMVGNEAQYVVWDAGFKFHVDAETIDRQVLRLLGEQIAEHKSQVAEGVMKMLGQDDLFTKAAIDYSLDHMDQSFDQVIANGLPESARTYLGMLGFRIVVNYHGELVRVEQPGIVSDEGE